jgi:hypothetical protein
MHRRRLAERIPRCEPRQRDQGATASQATRTASRAPAEDALSPFTMTNMPASHVNCGCLHLVLRADSHPEHGHRLVHRPSLNSTSKASSTNRGREQESMTIQPVDVQHFPLVIEVKRRQIIRQGGPHLRVEFEDARFGQRREHRISRRQQFQNSADGSRRAIVSSRCLSHRQLVFLPREARCRRGTEDARAAAYDAVRSPAHGDARSLRERHGASPNFALRPCRGNRQQFPHRGARRLERKFPSETRLLLLPRRWKPPSGRRDYPAALHSEHTDLRESVCREQVPTRAFAHCRFVRSATAA